MTARSGAFVLTMLVVVATGCVSQASLPEDCQAASVQRDATLAGARLDPEAIDVCKGQHVTIQIGTELAGELAGELHLHGYDDQAPEVPVEPGNAASFEFSASRAGQFVIELHDEETGEETEVGLLTVHEP